VTKAYVTSGERVVEGEVRFLIVLFPVDFTNNSQNGEIRAQISKSKFPAVAGLPAASAAQRQM
jgi:hypothetical protein